jgi:hypothetical protein
MGSCVRGAGKGLVDTGPCDRLDDGKLKDECYQGMTLEKKDLFGRNVDAYKDFVLKDASTCKRLGEVLDEINCYRDVAVAQKDQSICEFISTSVNSYDKNRCYLDVAMALRTDKDACKKIYFRMDRDSCLSSVAENLGDQSACLEIESNITRNHCLKKLGVN